MGSNQTNNENAEKNNSQSYSALFHGFTETSVLSSIKNTKVMFQNIV